MKHARRTLTALFVSLFLLAALPAMAAAAGDLQAETSPLSFPTTGIHDSASTQSTKITNIGDEDAAIQGVNVAAPFSIDGNSSDCDDNPTLSPGGSCNLVVSFSPSTVGPAASTVAVQYFDSVTGQTLEVQAEGSGATGTLSAPAPSFNVQPYYFGGQQVQVNVSNPSSYTVIAESASIVGPDAASFYVSSNGCNGNFLSPGNNCNIYVGFNPGAPGDYDAELLIDNSGTTDPVSVPLEVTVLEGPKAVIDPPDIEFGAVKVGAAAPTKQVLITNDGDFPLQIQQLLILSGTPQVFPISNDSCTLAQINPGDSCEITVGFNPTKAGERNASIFVISNTPGPVTTSSLSGEGVFAPAGSVSLTGGAQVGVPIVCLTSGYREGDALSYRWLRAGSAIAGEAQQTYVPVAADAGSTIACEVTAANVVGTETLTSAPSAVIAPQAAGPQGVQGIQGPAGKQGPKGKPGPKGKQGAKGKPGKRGPKGKPAPHKSHSCKAKSQKKAKKQCSRKVRASGR